MIIWFGSVDFGSAILVNVSVVGTIWRWWGLVSRFQNVWNSGRIPKFKKIILHTNLIWSLLEVFLLY